MKSGNDERQLQQYIWDGTADTILAWSERVSARDHCQRMIQQLEGAGMTGKQLVLPLVELSLRQRDLLNGESRFLPPQQQALAILRTVLPCEGKSDPEVLEMYAAEVEGRLPEGAHMLRTLAGEISRNVR